MNWVNKHKLPAVKAIKHNGHLCLKIKDLWQALYLLFNIAQNYQIDISVLDKIPNKCLMGWGPFSEEEFISSISKCNNLLSSGLKKLS